MKYLFLLVAIFTSFSYGGKKIEWQEWSGDIFKKAREQKKLVLLDMEAVWCHWCHVMDEKTYSQPEIISLINEHYIPVKVDQDSRPDLSRRYENYGWPAIILFSSEGKELAKRRGYQEASAMKNLLKKLSENPIPEEKEEEAPAIFSESAFLDKKLKAQLETDFVDSYDTKKGGWGGFHKFLFGFNEEWAMWGAWSGKKKYGKMAQETLNKGTLLIDKIWGGAYQYSVGSDWKEPHFEKIAERQFASLTLYSLGYALFKSPVYLTATQNVQKFVANFMRDGQGAFYTSQDADVIKGTHSDSFFKLNDENRRKKGMPAIDKNIYARENGWYIRGLISSYEYTGDEKALSLATEAARWVIANRQNSEGGFQHSGKDIAGPYLGDTLEMGFALLQLYEATAERKYLVDSERAAQYLIKKFAHNVGEKKVGYDTAFEREDSPIKSSQIKEENVEAARYLNSLYHYTGDKNYLKGAEIAMKYLATGDIALEESAGGSLLANEEMSTPPVHIVIVGSKKDLSAKELFRKALSYPVRHHRIEWLDKEEGPLPNKDVTYPELSKPAAFGCAGGRCSIPITDPKILHSRIDKLYNR